MLVYPSGGGGGISNYDLIADGIYSVSDVARVNTEAELTSAIAGAKNTILVDGDITLTGNHTVTQHLIIRNGAVITTGSNILTISGPFTAGCCQVFSGTGVIFTSKTSVLVDWFGAVADGNTDSSDAVKLAIAATPLNGRLMFGNTNSDGYILASLGTIVNTITIDLNGATIKADGDLITFGSHAEAEKPSRIINGYITMNSGATITDLIKLDGNRNTVITDLMLFGITAGSIINNAAAYGVRISDCEFRWNTVSDCTLKFQTNSEITEFSYAFLVDHIDISSNTGIGVKIEGGNGAITNSVIESCSGGGIQFTESDFSGAMLIERCHFEANSDFDIKFQPFSNPIYSQTKATRISSCVFIHNTTYEHIYLDGYNHVEVSNCFFQYGGISGAAVDQYCYLVLTNCFRSQNTVGWSGTNVISDAILGLVTVEETQQFYYFDNFTIAASSNTDVVASRKLNQYKYDVWELISHFGGLQAVVNIYVFRYTTNITSKIHEIVDAMGLTITVTDNTDGTYTINVANDDGDYAQLVAIKLIRSHTYGYAT